MRKILLLAALAFSLIQTTAWGLGEETFGNAPLSELNYTQWPGIMPLVNDASRVYHSWVNGNEHFYYRGDAKDLNEALQDFAQVKTEVREVVLHPGKGKTTSFHGKEVAFDWELHLVGGIAAHLSTLEKGQKIWPKHPMLTIYLGDSIDLDQLKIPENVQVTGLEQLRQRHQEALSSSDKTVRGWGAGKLARLDPHSTESMKVVAELMADPEPWVRLNAAGALALYGETAEPALPELRKALETADEQLRERIEKTIETIEQADAAESQEQQAGQRRQTMQKIEKFLQARNRQP